MTSVEEALAVGEVPDLGDWLAPQGLGPLPDALRERATAALQAMFELERAVGERLELVGRELSGLVAARPGGRAAARPAYGGLDLDC